MTAVGVSLARVGDEWARPLEGEMSVEDNWTERR